jgi:phosphatidyl-myo-inositol dimannoside synthase
MPRLFLGVESLSPGNGGICRVARLMARVIGEEYWPRSSVSGIILSDQSAPNDIPFPIRTARSSRSAFVTAVTLAALNHTHFLYDCGGMARAHGWLPWPRRPSMVFLNGIEAWLGTAHPMQVRALQRATELVTITDYSRDRAAGLSSNFARATVCWLATEEDTLPPPANPLGDRPPRIVILSRIDDLQYKGHRELIECWPTVVSAVPGAILTVVGRGSALGTYQALAANLGLGPENVEFRGFVPEADMSAVWNSTRVFAMPSRGEGFGLVYIEAMRYGIPVIASIHDAGQEVNQHGETGYNVDLDKPGQLTDRLIELLRDPDRASILGENGRRRWFERFRYSAFRTRFTPILNRFLAH